MKRNKFVIATIVCCLILLLPITVYAETYRIGDTDMSVRVDDSLWYVFTRDNIENNDELEELGIPYDEMHDILYDNEAYMDAILLYEDGSYVEFLVRKRALDTGMVNLSNYTEKQVLKFAKALAERQKADEYSVYEGKYKFARSEYVDSDLGYYVCEYITIVNKDNYTFTFQATAQFTDEEYEEIENIIDSINFDVDTSLKEKNINSFWTRIIYRTIGGAIIGGIAGAVIAIVNKKKKKKTEEQAPADTEEIQ